MRLFCLIPNYVFFGKMTDELKIRSIECDDLIGTYHDNFTYDLPVILTYFDKEDWEENSICCFTTPAEAKQYLDDDSILIAFETNNSEHLQLNANKYYDYLKVKINFEKEFDIALNSADEERCERLNSAFEKFEDKMISEIASPKNFYDSLVVVPDIPLSSVKAIYAYETNRDLKDIKKRNDYNLIVEKNPNKTIEQSKNAIVGQGK